MVSSPISYRHPADVSETSADMSLPVVEGMTTASLASSASCSPDFAFFGVFDGHNGHYVSEALQKSLYVIFRGLFEESFRCMELESVSARALKCLRGACAQADKDILSRDFEKQMQLKEERHADESRPTHNRAKSSIRETLSFAGTPKLGL
jgi:serine/threonine protein phosphatase PrpC